MTVLERPAMEEVYVRMASLTTPANVMMDILEKTAKQVSDSDGFVSGHYSIYSLTLSLTLSLSYEYTN